MKKTLLGFLMVLLTIAVLSSCSSRDKVAVPGEFAAELEGSDNITLSGIGYRSSGTSITAIGERPELAELAVLGALDDDAGKTAYLSKITFRGEEHSLKYGMSSKYSRSRVGFDLYYSSSENIRVIYTKHGTEDIIGYSLRITDQMMNPVMAPLDSEKLIELAREGLSEFMDADYYSNTDIEHDSMLDAYSVTFYNDFCGVTIADRSLVTIRRDGTVIDVLAVPDPDMKKALKRYASIEIADFDATVEAQLRTAYPNYSCDNENVLADVSYGGMEINSCLLTLDSNNAPLLWYYVTPKLTYDITYRGEWAEAVTSRGDDVHETGVSRPPVYAVVYLADQ